MSIDIDKFTYEVKVDNENYNPKSFATGFYSLATTIRFELQEDPSHWSSILPYKNNYFEIWETSKMNGQRLVAISLIGTSASALLRFHTHCKYTEKFWNEFPKKLQEICDLILIAIVQST